MDGMVVKNPVVYVVQEKHDMNFLPAQQYGELVALLGHDDQVVINSIPTTRTVLTKMRRFGDDDFVLAVGDPAAIGIVCSVAARLNGGRFKLLKWDRMERRYYVVQVDLEEADKLNNGESMNG